MKETGELPKAGELTFINVAHYYEFPRKPWEDDSSRSGGGKYNLIWNQERKAWGLYLDPLQLMDFIYTVGQVGGVRIIPPCEPHPEWEIIVTYKDRNSWGQR